MEILDKLLAAISQDGDEVSGCAYSVSLTNSGIRLPATLDLAGMRLQGLELLEINMIQHALVFV